MIDPSRHVPLRSMLWSAFEASAAIEEIVADAATHFHPERFWPSHPLEDGRPDGMANLYFGAAGVIWGLDYLARSGAIRTRFDFRPVLTKLLEASAAEFAAYKYPAHGAFLLGDLGAALTAMRIGPSADVADLVHERCERNSALPIRELMWGLPGSMLACVHMHAMTGEAGWRRLFAAQAGRLLDDLEETALAPLWKPGPLRQRAALARSRARVRGQHDPAFARLGMADAIPASTRRGRRATHAGRDCLPVRGRFDMACGCDPAGPADPLSVLPRCSGYGDDVRRRTVRVVRA